MPTYAYACRQCDHAFDIQQSFADDSLTVCPECEGDLRKKFNSVGVVFKGSGFYRNDSRETKSSTVPKKDSGSTSSTSGDSSSTSSSSGGTTAGSASSGSGTSSSSAGSSSTGSSSSASKAASN